MSLKINRRQVEGVNILELSGRITLGEGSQTFGDAVRDLLERGENRILINMGDVSYIDSSGIGELFRAVGRGWNSGSPLRFVNLTKKVRDLLQMTKIYTVIEVFEDERAALLSFQKRFRYVLCPSCTHRMEPPKIDESYSWPLQTCRSCLAECEISNRSLSSSSGNVIEVRLETYPGEYVKVKSESDYYVLSIAGRLGKFASLALRKLWRAMPKPRAVLLVLDEKTIIEDAGLDALLGCIGELEASEAAAVFLSEIHAEHRTTLASRVQVCKDLDETAKTLGKRAKKPAWFVSIETEGAEQQRA
ncbi:MAG TPA: STAS domain-containing protein [Bryobacteraceae bacterium]|jgi:anti-sigma B factor antagonist|nr:STAS domain-containing protein [Bryobacteraceae bacterium]